MSDPKSEEAPVAPLPPTNRSLPFALMRARERVMAPIREMLSDSGISEQQWRVLRVLSENGPLDAGRLAEHACLLPPSVTRLVQSMLQKNLVTRETDQNDRRRQVVALTPKGQTIIDDNAEQAAVIAARYEQIFGREGYHALLDALERLGKL